MLPISICDSFENVWNSMRCDAEMFDTVAVFSMAWNFGIRNKLEF